MSLVKTYSVKRPSKYLGNCDCSVNSWVGGPTPSVPPSAGNVEHHLGLDSTPFFWEDHPRSADPALAFGKIAAETPSANEANAHLSKHTWLYRPILLFSFTADDQAHSVCLVRWATCHSYSIPLMGITQHHC